MTIVQSTSKIQGQEVAIYIEVDQVPEAVVPQGFDYGTTRSSNAEKAAEAVKDLGDLFGQGITLARTCAAEAIQNFNKMHNNVKPDEVELQLGIKLGSKVGAVLAQANGEAQINVKMTWKLKEDLPKLATQDNSQQAVS